MSRSFVSTTQTRFSAVLVTLLLLIIVAVAAYTITLLQAQRTALEDSVAEAQAHAVALLAEQIEQVLNRAMRPPFLGLKNLPFDAIAGTELTQAFLAFPEFRRVIFLSGDLRVVGSYPASRTADERALNHWLAERVVLEKFDRRAFAVHTFIEYIDGNPELFALQRSSELDLSSGWLLVNFNLREIIKRHIDPILSAFDKQYSGSIALQDAQADWDDNALNWPAGHTLPGWMLVYRPDPAEAAERVRHAMLTVVGVGAGVVVVLVFGAYLLWNEVRRERAVANLRNNFVASVSHELKTPLTLIRMYAETLYMQRITDAGRKQTYLRTILREAERLTYMIESVLDFSRLNQGVTVYQLNDTDLRTTLLQVVDTYGARVTELGLTLETDIEDIPAVAHDRRGITQIVVNLFDNALKYAAAGGVVRMQLHRLGSGEIELAVSDRGPGIAAQERERVKRAFEQSSGSGRATGAGLGLALVEQIANAHGARFLLEDGPDGLGLKASVVFPLVRVDQ